MDQCTLWYSLVIYTQYIIPIYYTKILPPLLTWFFLRLSLSNDIAIARCIFVCLVLVVVPLIPIVVVVVARWFTFRLNFWFVRFILYKNRRREGKRSRFKTC